jgi:hypothetical protein
MSTGRGKILFICGSHNQTTQMHQIAQQLPEYDCWFTPYYCDWFMDTCRKLGLIEMTIGGNRARKRCTDYLAKHGLKLDLHGQQGGYDLVVTCTDMVVPENIRKYPIVVVQEGILDPQNWVFHIVTRLTFFPRWLASTSTTGLSHLYAKFCVASEGYRDHFIGIGCDPAKVVVTGIPNFDNCDRYYQNSFPHKGYCLVVTSDMRETFKYDNRKKLIQRVVKIAKGKQIIFKLHPNEKRARAEEEIQRWAPGALVYQDGSAEEMIANSDIVVTQYSSTIFVAMALGKESYSYFDVEELKKLVPVQNKRAAANVADVCRGVLQGKEIPARMLGVSSGEVVRESAEGSSPEVVPGEGRAYLAIRDPEPPKGAEGAARDQATRTGEAADDLSGRDTDLLPAGVSS